jgi:hypothetical protein
MLQKHNATPALACCKSTMRRLRWHAAKAQRVLTTTTNKKALCFIVRINLQTAKHEAFLQPA